jgi:hypothetical protein
LKAFGRWAQASATHDEAAAVLLVRLDDSLCEPEPLREFERGGLLRDERVGAAFEQEAFAAVRADSSARAARSFEEQ